MESFSRTIQTNLELGVKAVTPGYTPQYNHSIRALTSSSGGSLFDFTFFQPNTTNVGIQLVYRQEWRLLGAQRGEVVRTLPLGPRQTEKVSIRLVRRNKVSRTAESLKSVESSTEVTDTSRDSSELVNETTETNGWKVEAGGSVGFGGMGVSASGGMNSEATNKVANTSTALSEAVQKTANKVRMESKLVVSTEGETTFEATTASELQNPNDEVAITYVYSKLQRQYEVFTHLNEVNTVIFVAEQIPTTNADLEQFVKKNDWIIAKALLDDSFRDALSALSQDLKQEPIPSTVVSKYESAMDNMMGTAGILRTFAQNTTNLALTQADPSQEIQRTLQQITKEKQERKRSGDLYDMKLDRLLEHVRKNILHYCRAVWSQEDHDQRMLRYEKAALTVPTVWQFTVGTATLSLAELAADPTLLLTGTWEPDPASFRPVKDVINPAGPIAYHGNYAVFYARPNLRLGDVNLFDILDFMRDPYVSDTVPPQFLDPAREYIRVNNPMAVGAVPAAVRAEMVQLLPDLRAAYEELGTEAERTAFMADATNMIFTPDLYWDYLFRWQFTRQLVLDTNNLVLDIETGSGSTLEGFKRLHRYVDVLKALEERNKALLENDRLTQRLTAGQYGDPDIENVTMVTADITNEGRDLFIPPGHLGRGDDG